ncbi:MAG: helix-turn-helix transcriptional regulator [Bacillales bacterium]|nr:helix-turn-helix transcriptional regulator [Bacillales bacterium]
MKLNDRIKMIMEEKGLTQKELSQMSNITEASMSKYLSGDRTPRIDVIVNIANALEVSVDSLLGGANSTINGLMDAKLVLARGKDTLSEDDKKELIKFLLEN